MRRRGGLICGVALAVKDMLVPIKARGEMAIPALRWCGVDSMSGNSI